MKLAAALALCLALPIVGRAQPPTLQLAGPPSPAFAGGWPACDAHDIPDAPARALRVADGSVQLYVADQTNRLNVGPDLRHLHHDCAVIYRGAWNDDPAAYDDRTWITSVWTEDGRTIWAILHNEFHGHARRALCPTGRYMDCWYNALTAARSTDAGHSFHRAPGDAIVAALPYRYDQIGLGHHGYFNPTNIIQREGFAYMFAFATQAQAQRGGNCLFRTETVSNPASWRAWDGEAFTTGFESPYTHALMPEQHVCAPVAVSALRWPVTSLVRHAPTNTYIATMQNAAADGGVYYATSPDLLHWSAPVRLVSAPGLSGWTCGAPAPIAYPSLIDPDSPDRNFQTVGAHAELFAILFNVENCRIAPLRTLIRWPINLRLSGE